MNMVGVIKYIYSFFSPKKKKAPTYKYIEVYWEAEKCILKVKDNANN